MFGFLSSLVSVFIPSLSTVLGDVLKVGIKALNSLAEALTAFAKEMGVVETQDAEELGTKRMQADEAGIKPEDFDSFDEYTKVVDDFEIDEEKALQTPLEEKLSKATQHTLEAMQHKFPEADVSDLAKGVLENPEFYEDSERFTELAKLVGNDPEKVANIGKLLCGKLEGDEFNDTIDLIVSAEQARSPDLSIKEIRNKVQDLLNNK